MGLGDRGQAIAEAFASMLCLNSTLRSLNMGYNVDYNRGVCQYDVSSLYTHNNSDVSTWATMLIHGGVEVPESSTNKQHSL